MPVDGQQQPFRGCDNCDYYEARDVRRDDDSLSRLREIAEERLQDMGGEEIALQTRRFRRLSRIWYALALLVAAGALALVMLQLFGLTFVFLLLFSINLAAQGMAASYRYWQLSHRTLFVRGAFRQWLRNGEWII
ncbi:hypothetical protein [Cupriavidus pampae]|uniref:hypothetical protein n=1 Tax=Cupriavidus pampae TaxID=659251 RepID=UPI001CC45FB1|nr:hypothetical protein [Cupriavidus pampae]